MSREPLRVAIVGCGNIAGRYAETLKAYPQVRVLGAYDLITERAEAMVAQHGGRVYQTLDDVLADSEVEVVVNLTIHHAHAEVISRCLNAGKHVYSEKPLALTYSEARGLVDLAAAKGLRLSCAPMTFMGEAQQTAWKVIREGRLGKVRLVYAEVNHGRIESWHPNPEPFYKVGVLFDVGVYPLTLVTTFFGPARRVTAFGTVLYPDRVTKEGRPFHIDTPDCVLAAIELADGTIVRLTANFYVRSTLQRGLEFHGDLGSLHLGCFQSFNAAVQFARFGEGFEPVPYVRPPFEGIDWGRGPAEMADAMAAGRRQRTTGAQAAHIVEILEAITTSFHEGRPVDVSSTFEPPAPMEWAQ
ncbi:MAG: Gfo/Idh/MocA family protein [Anaerolineae bacterium]